jgi:tetratricopeptide (TPR) repeat protein
MRAEHRHELKTNELAEWMGTLPVSIKQYSKTIILVSVAVVAVVSYYFYYRYQIKVAKGEQIAVTGILSQLSVQKAQIARAQAGGDETSYILLQMEQGLQNIAGGSKQDSLRALSLIKEAEIIRAELHLRFKQISPQDFAAAIGRAKDNYTKALDTYLKQSPNSAIEAMAKMGLGLCEEELGNFEQAKKLYNEVATAREYAGTTSAEVARQRLNLMDNFNNQKIALKPEPRPAAIEIAEPNQPAPPTLLFGETAHEANVQGVNLLP